jgi:hypothetical protein
MTGSEFSVARERGGIKGSVELVVEEEDWKRRRSSSCCWT